jgi:hypothetical protein
LNSCCSVINVLDNTTESEICIWVGNSNAMRIGLQFQEALEKIYRYHYHEQCLFGTKGNSDLITSEIPHKNSAISVKQATIGTVFRQKSPKSHII